MTVAMTELERWRGETDARLKATERRLDALNGTIADGTRALNALTLTVTEFRSSVKAFLTVFGVVVSFVSPVITGITVFFITN